MQVVVGGKVPTKPGGCNCSHIPKALHIQHPTGLLKLQPSHKPLVPGPPQAPVTLELSRKKKNKSLLKKRGDRKGMLRTAELL